eukprot:TRINITY_DN5276_c0_g1_i1.p1 TRINITY_DN5276_c0_g1~~TRINITY_DN5276_c0_g1_i1.p1  ORF type:complete len:378 (-),score=48.54 TRINITY_DN5276_c0_g1_i1:356-1489(-)
MWSPGHYYWERNEQTDSANGIIVVSAWMFSERRNLLPYIRLYRSLGWDSLVAHAHFLNGFFPTKALTLASIVLEEISKEIGRRPRPLVFAGFSGGPLCCMVKIFQILEEKCMETNPESEKYRSIKKCVAGQIYDSTPVDFTSEAGINFCTNPTILKRKTVPRVWRWGIEALSWMLESLFLTRFERMRAEYWQILYSLVYMGPIVILCSEDDELAEFQTIQNFATHLNELGGLVRFISWKKSAHVGHYRYHPEDYRSAIAWLLDQAVSFHLLSDISHKTKAESPKIMNSTSCRRGQKPTAFLNADQRSKDTSFCPERFEEQEMQSPNRCRQRVEDVHFEGLISDNRKALLNMVDRPAAIDGGEQVVCNALTSKGLSRL